MTDWYIAIVHRDGSVSAMKELRSMGCEVYYPVERHIKKFMNKRREVETNGLHKYILVRNASPHEIIRARGVWMMVPDADGNPGIATQQEYENLKHEETRQCDHTWLPEDVSRPGARVRVVEGLLDDSLATVRHKSKTGYIRALVDGYTRPIDLPIDSVVPA